MKWMNRMDGTMKVYNKAHRASNKLDTPNAAPAPVPRDKDDDDDAEDDADAVEAELAVHVVFPCPVAEACVEVDVIITCSLRVANPTCWFSTSKSA